MVTSNKVPGNLFHLWWDIEAPCILYLRVIICKILHKNTKIEYIK